ncbi:UxaA family hydrolase [Paenibacillus yanchengensis]|uniref:UxaA family hydrolase n=1 Tax=Paenibacillus yanchengensis TaxID=2035833 RepID=A0ABW4YNH5_9BACL
MNTNIEWQGYARKNGRKGIRNKILVMYTVECASFVAKEVGIHFRNTNIDVDVVGFTGCTDNQYALNMLLALIRHPNVGAVLVIGLGCEYLQADKLAAIAKEEEKPAQSLLIQNSGGTITSIAEAKEMVTILHEQLRNKTVRVTMSVDELVIGAECGGSDYTSGLAGNVVVGSVFDYIVEQGGTAIFEEIVEAIGLKDMLVSRGKTKQVGEQLLTTYNKMLDYCKSVRQYSVSPGNFAGGLTTIEEKSMGAFVKSGSKPIAGVLKVAQSAPEQGLWLLDSVPDPTYMSFGYTNPNDSEGLMDLVCSGAHVLLFVTGRGTVVGSAVSPVIKVTGNRHTYRRMSDDIDFCASDMLTGEATLAELTSALFQMIISTCQGEQTKAELLHHKEYYIPYKYQSAGTNCEG